MKWWHLDQQEVTETQLYIINLATATSRWLNTVALGDPKESICSRVNRHAEAGNKAAQELERIINICFLEPDHCKKARTVPDRCREIKL